MKFFNFSDRLGRMEKEGPKFGVAYEIGSPHYHTDRDHFEENHAGIPGQAGASPVTVETIVYEGLPISIRIMRENSVIPSTATEYSYVSEDGKRTLSKVESFLFDIASNRILLAERMTQESDSKDPEKKEIKQSFFPNNPDIPAFMKELKEQRWGEPVDYTSLIDNARIMQSPAIKVSQVQDNDQTFTFITTARVQTFEDGITYMYARVWAFKTMEGANVLVQIRSIKGLKAAGKEGIDPDSRSETTEFFYENGGVTVIGKNFYKGEELLYADYYFPQEFLGETVFSVTRIIMDYGMGPDFLSDGIHYSFEDLLTKDYWADSWYAFGARVSDSIPLLERKKGDVFTRTIDFPTISGKKIKVQLKVVEMGQGGVPKYEKQNVELVAS